MHQAQGSAGQTGDDHHREWRRPGPVDQGEAQSQFFQHQQLVFQFTFIRGDKVNFSF